MGAEPREVYRDRWLLVVDKPAGLPTQRTRAGEPGLYEHLKARDPYVGLHHRLDRNVSGLVLFTLDPGVNGAVGEALRERTLTRRYRALLEGIVKDGTWSGPVYGKPARTDVRVEAVAGGVSRVELTLHSGRKHQIRVHAALAGTPIVGDTRYGGDLTRPLPRLALHAWRLCWTHPRTGAALDLVAPLPWDALMR